MEKQNTIIVGSFFAIVLFIISIGVISNFITDSLTEPINTTNAVNIAQAVPFNITLNSECLTIKSVSNGTVIPATNYTDYCSTDGILQMNDNSSYKGAVRVSYEYNDNTTIKGAGAGLLVLTTLFIVLGFIMAIFKKAGVR